MYVCRVLYLFFTCIYVGDICMSYLVLIEYFCFFCIIFIRINSMNVHSSRDRSRS